MKLFTPKAPRHALALFVLALAVGLYFVAVGDDDLKLAVDVRNAADPTAAASASAAKKQLKNAEDAHFRRRGGRRGEAHFDGANGESPHVPQVYITIGPDLKVVQGPRTWGGLTEEQVSDQITAVLEHLRDEIEVSDEQLQRMEHLLVLAAYTAKNSTSGGRPAALRWLDDPEQRAKIETRLLLLFGDAARVDDVFRALDEVLDSPSLGTRRRQ